jgi:hypothetical protein
MRKFSSPAASSMPSQSAVVLAVESFIRVVLSSVMAGMGDQGSPDAFARMRRPGL